MPNFSFFTGFRFSLLLFFITAVLPYDCPAQNINVVKKIKIYNCEVSADSNSRMMELKVLIPSLSYQLHYATVNNFTHTRLYRNPEQAFLRMAPAKALKLIQDELNQKGLGLKIFDAYRPYSVTVKMWHLIGDERYVANPSKGSGHNRGLAVDLTLAVRATGKELDMGTGFDNFSDTAHHAFDKLPGHVIQNRRILREVMEKYGFRPLETEWWHYSWPNDRNYSVLDIDPSRLGRPSKPGDGNIRGGDLRVQ